MAYSVNSIVGTISGTVAYTDNSTSSFNAELNYNGTATLNFVCDATESQNTLARLYDASNENAASDLPDNTFRDGFTNLNTITSTLFSTLNWNPYMTLTDDGKVISDVVFHMNYNITFDDGTAYPVSATFEKVGGVYARTNHSGEIDVFSGASNKADIVTKIADSFKQVIDITSYS